MYIYGHALMKDTEERNGKMSDDFIEEEFERDRNEAFRLRGLVEARFTD